MKRFFKVTTIISAIFAVISLPSFIIIRDGIYTDLGLDFYVNLYLQSRFLLEYLTIFITSFILSFSLIIAFRYLLHLCKYLIIWSKQYYSWFTRTGEQIDLMKEQNALLKKLLEK